MFSKAKVIDQGSAKPDYGFSGGFLVVVRNIGKSLIYPIAILPFAAILMRFGILFEQIGTDTSGVHDTFIYWFGFIIQVPGTTIFNNLGLIFGVGVAFGFAKDHRGEAALVGLVAYLILIGLVEAEDSLPYLIYHNVMTVEGDNGLYYSKLLYLVPIEGTSEGIWLLDLGVFGGMEAGLISAYCYNRYSNVKLPSAFSFFSGRRFVPIVVISVMIVVSCLTAVIWPWFQVALVLIAVQIVKVPCLGAGLYAFLNRLLVPFGLHQVLNIFFFFQMPITLNGDQIMVYDSQTNELVPLLGDINAYMQAGNIYLNGLQVGDLTLEGGSEQIWAVLDGAHVGAFQTGFFPIIMGGVPGIAIAMSLRAEGQYRKQVTTFMISSAFIAFFIGVTEPIEYSFMFISPILYFSYAVLSGIVAAATVATGISFGFGFFSGFIDLMASIPTANNLYGVQHPDAFGGLPIIIMLGMIIAAFLAYFLLGWIFIKAFDIASPGRKGNMSGIVSDEDQKKSKKKVPDPIKKGEINNLKTKKVDVNQNKNELDKQGSKSKTYNALQKEIWREFVSKFCN